jgi:Resolvase, N terminal domain
MHKGRRIGYTRVGTLDQNTERQLDGIEVDRTFTDSASGKDTKRPQWTAAREDVWEGDILLMHSMDRLARNAEDLLRIVRELTARGVTVEFVKNRWVSASGTSEGQGERMRHR